MGQEIFQGSLYQGSPFSSKENLQGKTWKNASVRWRLRSTGNHVIKLLTWEKENVLAVW